MGRTVPLRIDSELVNQARNAGSLHDRPPTAQIEHWAKLGRVLDSVLCGKSIAHVKQLSRVDELEAILAMTQTPAGQEKALAEIAKHKGPVYSADPERPDVVLQKLPDGTTRSGHFVNRQFVPEPRTSRSVARKRGKNRTRTRAVAGKG